MSNYKGFRTGSNSYGQFWFGGSTFPGFLYKKNLGAGGRRSTQFTPGGTITCNQPTDLYNKYKPGGGGVGASSMSNRRAKNRLATVCLNNSCFPCYNTLGQYSNYTHNPNGFIPCPSISIGSATPSPSGPYTVTYFGNGSNGGSVPVDSSSPYTAGSTVTVLGNTFTRTGYIFAGWSTNSGGTGSDYNGSDLFTINANTTLYAQWIPIINGDYTLTYNGNGQSGGSLPALTTEYPEGTNITVLGNSGSLAKSGYQFGGWNTAADGSGTNYVGGDTFTIPSSNTTLYAKWVIQNSARLIYNAGTGGGIAPSSSNTSYTAFSTQPVVGNTGSFARSGYTFAGWNTTANGTGTSYPVGSNIIMPCSGAVNLYAQWIPNGSGPFTLTYDGNGSTGGTVPIDGNSPYSAGSPANVVGNTGILTNSSLPIFNGWNTVQNPTTLNPGTSYPAGSKITMTANTTLYAQWGNTPSVRVTYNANQATGGSVPAVPTDYPSGVQVPILGQGSLTRQGYTFLGWQDITGSSYVPGFTFTSKTVTLLAQWAPGSSIRNCGTDTIQLNGAWMFIPYSQFIQSSDTITLYITSLVGTTTSNYGSGLGPYGIISFSNKTVITQTDIKVFTNTTYLNSANDFNYTKTVINGPFGDVTYWPSGATISSISFSGQNKTNSLGPPTYSIATTNSFGGCGSTSINNWIFLNQTLTMNFSNGSNTFVANSPNSFFYTTNTSSPYTFTNPPKTLYPYADYVGNVSGLPKSDNTITTITLIPSTSSSYVFPPQPNYTVEYNGNGNTGGFLPPPEFMAPYTGATPTFITISNNLRPPPFPTAYLTKSGSVFSKWNTVAIPTISNPGTEYGPGTANTTYNGSVGNLILYAQWG
jgi:uncharacterized repeat protein (TIGR02543 family)